MPGNTDVHDEVLARAAAGGDRDAFGTLFERHLPSVFAAAWLVLHDRVVAAEIARDTFAAAWQHVGAVEPAAFASSLVESADHKATAWLNENPQALATANTPIPDEPANVGPVLRARIVTALEIHGIPTKPRTDAKPAALLDLGPHRDGRERFAQRFSGLLASRARLGILGAAAVVLLVGGGVVVIGDGVGGSSSDDDGIETAAADDDPESEVRDLPWKPSSSEDDDGDPTSSTASSTTTTDGTTTTETPDPAGERTPSTSQPRPTTTARPSNPPPVPTPPTPTTAPRPPTTPAPTEPTILEFTARRDGKCQDGREWVVFTWRTVQATWVWIWPSNAPDPWQDVPGPNGSTGRCSWPGERWNLSIRRQSDGKEVWKTITV